MALVPKEIAADILLDSNTPVGGVDPLHDNTSPMEHEDSSYSIRCESKRDRTLDELIKNTMVCFVKSGGIATEAFMFTEEQRRYLVDEYFAKIKANVGHGGYAGRVSLAVVLFAKDYDLAEKIIRDMVETVHGVKIIDTPCELFRVYVHVLRGADVPAEFLSRFSDFSGRVRIDLYILLKDAMEVPLYNILSQKEFMETKYEEVYPGYFYKSRPITLSSKDTPPPDCLSGDALINNPVGYLTLLNGSYKRGLSETDKKNEIMKFYTNLDRFLVYYGCTGFALAKELVKKGGSIPKGVKDIPKAVVLFYAWKAGKGSNAYPEFKKGVRRKTLNPF